MQLRSFALLAPALALTLLVGGCNNGSTTGSSLGTPKCSSGTSKFCLVSCSLGCSETGCSVSRIAQNQPISLTFSQLIDPASVSTASVSLRTSTGEPPIGDLLVRDNIIEFRPKIEISGGNTFFGFRANETYVLTLPAGGGETLRSASGNELGSQVVCQLRVDQGIVDLDNQPPRSTLLSPTGQTGVSPGTSIVIEFSELIDAAPFAGGSEGGPVEFFASVTTQSNGQAVCDEQANRVPLPGVPRVTLDAVRNKATVSFRPSVQLPGEACIEVRVTNRVRDLSGRAAEPAFYRFVTDRSGVGDLSVEETFDSTSRLDLDVSSTRWQNGSAFPGVVGGSGKHGEFDITLGSQNGNTFVWDLGQTGGFVIPAALTLTGRDEVVTDGKFEFTRFELKSTETLRITGPFPAVFRVRGEVILDGTIDVAGGNRGLFLANNTVPVQGQPGGAGGPGGGRGGSGAAAPAPTGSAAGENGEDVQVVANHAYMGSVMGTGGPGAPMHPTSRAAVEFNYLNVICAQLPAGAGGAGYSGAGTMGTATRGPVMTDLGPPTNGGSTFPLFPLPAVFQSIEHFLVGGSGGGGGGPHAYNRSSALFNWRPGAGGAGGGGVVAFRSGGPVRMNATARINADGGSCSEHTNILQGPPGPAGGGAGGSVILQSGSAVFGQGIIDIRGGVGLAVTPNTASPTTNIITSGGDGATGFVRAEMPNNPGVSILPQILPAVDPTMVGDLQDEDLVTGFTTKWYTTGRIFPPRFKRYEIVVRVGSGDVVFSDDPAFGTFAGPESNQAIRVLFQSGNVDPRDGNLTGPPGPLRETVGAHQGQAGLTQDLRTGFRFVLLFDRMINTEIEVKSVKVIFEG